VSDTYDDRPVTDLRIDRLDIFPFITGTHTNGRIVFIEAAAEATRYHMIVVTDRVDGWWIACENLSIPFILPVMPYLPGWRWQYLQGKLPDHNERTARALALILNVVHEQLNTWNAAFAASTN